MTKCEEAQKGIDKIMEKLEDLCTSAHENYGSGFDYSKEKQSLSIQIRVNLVSLVRMMIHYGNHIGGFTSPPADLGRITYLESQNSIELQESEAAGDQERQDDELEHLGPIGFKNSNEEYLKFPAAID